MAQHFDDIRNVDHPALITVSKEANTVRPELAIIIPTRNEAENVGPLLERLVAALAGLPAGIIVGGGSDDATPRALAEPGAGMDRPVRLLHRRPSQRAGGLSTAVVSGMKVARAPW